MHAAPNVYGSGYDDGSNSPTRSETKPTHGKNSATTYLYPSKLFPPEAKASLNGVAAAAGKIGASPFD